MKLVPKKTFLLRQEDTGGKKKKDIVAHRGVAIEVTDAEAIKFYGYFDFENEKTGDSDKKKVVEASKKNKSLLRTV